MKITFVGAAHEVTGSCHYLEVGDKRILVDYGMEQGINLYENVPLPVDAPMIDYVLLTHAHIDHSGLLPLLYAKGFRGSIYATDATVDLCSIMLRDSAHIQMQEAEWRNRKTKRSSEIDEYVPLYNMQDADGAIKSLVPIKYGKKIKICNELSVRFTDVGHLLGSAAIEVWLTEDGVTKKVVFSGDIGNDNLPLIRNFTTIDEADYILCESTYGDRLHAAVTSDHVAELAGVIRDTFAKGGNVVIPSFAVGRTQEILFFIRQIKERHLLDDLGDFPVYVDSPLAVEATGVFNKNVYECFADEALELVKRGINPLVFTGLNLSITSDESKGINFDNEPKVIISASGMCEAGRIRHHLKHNLWREECTILFVGYQAVGTLGRSIVEGAKEVTLFGEKIEIRAKIAKLEGISGHADKAGLTRWMRGFKNDPQMVFIVHGDDSVTDSFAEYLHDEYGFNTYAPFSGTCYDLLTDEFVREEVGVRIEGARKKTRTASTVFERLLAAGQRLLAVISHNEGGANKDLAKFADQINSLCDKWDR